VFHVKHSRPGSLSFLTERLDDLERQGLRRRPPAAAPTDVLSFCSNDYLGLAARPASSAPSGSGASRLIAGERDEHRRLERAFAAYVGAEDALAFTSGYAANVGVISALAAPGDVIISDALNHASLIDGARLSRARVVVVPHLDLAALAGALREARPARTWVVLESYYSMDADGPDLVQVRELCDDAGAALVVDEAHALGVMGPGGRGRCAEAGVSADVLVGTLGKAFGGQGAFAAGPAVLREWLWNRARSFVFSTGLAPVSAASATRALEHVVEHPELPRRVLTLADRLRAGLIRNGAATIHCPPAASCPGDAPLLLGFGHVVPLVVGDPRRAVRLAALLSDRGVAVQPVRPPTVPSGTARLRLTVTARHSEANVDSAAAAFGDALSALRREEGRN